MASTTANHEETCTHCGSRLIHLDWEERLDSHQIQKLWRCLECKQEFVTLQASEEESVSGAEIVKPFFPGLLVG